VALSSLHHVIDLEWMKEAYRLTRKDGAPGIDGVTADDYATNLEANLLDLLDRIKSGRYKAPPVRRTYIPKADGSRRPLGIPTFEDKLAQGDRHGAGGGVRAGLPSLLIRIPAWPIGTSGIADFAYGLHEPKTAVGDRYRHRKILRFDSTLPPSRLS
jgi:hypothetical protein